MRSAVQRLSNGLRVVLRESHGAPVVAFQMWIGVGSADERPREAGLAHVLEHMLFKGTARRGVGEIARDVERAGGFINAWTSHDETVFHITMASRYADSGLDVIADAVRNAALDAEELSRELQVILEEISMGEDNPSRVATELLFERVFRAHPYGRPVIGRRETVSRFDAAAVRRFYSRWYVPTNAVLVVVGDFETARMKAAVERAFKGWKGGKRPTSPTRVAEPPQRRARFGGRVLPVSEANLAIGFPIPGFSHNDVPALDLLAAVLGQGASSRLETVVRREMGLATDVRAVSFTPKDHGVFCVFAMAPPEHLEPLSAAIAREVRELAARPISPREVEKARVILLGESVYSEETVDGIARKLGYYGLHSGDIEFERRYVAGLATADPIELREIAARYFLAGRASIAAVVPDPSQRALTKRLRWAPGKGRQKAVDLPRLGASLCAQVTGRFAPAGKPATRRRATQETLVHETSGGDVLLVRPDPSSQIVAARAAFLGGLRHEPARLAGASMLLANVLTRGTTSSTAREVSLRMDSLACSIRGFTGRNTFGIQGEFLSRGFAEGFELMAQCLTRPSLDDGEVRREKELLVDEIRASRDQLDYLAFEVFQGALFGAHPYGRSVMGTEETVAALCGDHLSKTLAASTAPGRMVLGVVGGVDPEEVIELVEKHLSDRPRRDEEPSAPAPWAMPPSPMRVGRVMRKEQSHVVIGFPGTTLAAEDRFAVDVLVEILGGHGGRLFAGVRERLGLAYSVTATSMEGIEPGYIAVYAGTSPGRERQVVDAVLEQLHAISSRRPSEAELSRVKRHLIGTRAISSQRVSNRAAGMSLGYLYGLGHDVDERYPLEIKRQRPGDVVEAAARYLDPTRMIVSCVGPAGAEAVDIP